MLPSALDFARGLLGLLVLVGVVERVEIEIVQILHRVVWVLGHSLLLQPLLDRSREG